MLNRIIIALKDSQIHGTAEALAFYVMGRNE